MIPLHVREAIVTTALWLVFVAVCLMSGPL
jgi:hypothetical protein